ncbi:secretin N-terminal domain-containing protein [Nitrospira moscoviensis]|uniref:secretin N-terminal domain-containing protein n=1 Tax=Nitrospira moscoviensis TaxID=42253 RepID=UPI0011AEBD62|nr:secretin N-terminal domain-containing protein [Nitrospira moscoviensis]
MTQIRFNMRETFFAVLVLLALSSAGCSLLASSDARRGDQHLAAGNWEEASLAYKQALKDDPFDASLQSKYALARERAAAMYEERGRALLKEHQIDSAIEQFKRALTIEPASSEHQSSLSEAIRLKESRAQYREAERLAQLGRTDEAMGGFARAAELDPTFPDPLESISRLTEEQQAIMRNDRMKQPVTLRFRNAGIKEVLEGVAKAGGFTLIFDKDVRNDPISISVQDTPFEDALNLILNSNSLFSRVVSPGVMIVSPNTKQKQEQYQDLMIRTFYLSTAKAKDMLVLLKGMLDSKRMHANEQLNAIIIRDQPEKLELAEKIILANDRQEPEVLFDLEVLEVNRTKNQTYGLNYPKQAGAGLIPPGFTGTLTADPIQMTYRQLTSLGPDSYMFRLPTSVLLDFFKQESDAKTLAAPKVRVMNNKKAEINIGDKQPILLSTTNVLPGQAATGAVPTTSTVTSIEFRDTGVKLTVEPTIRLGNELSLKMKVEVIRIGDQVTLQASPPIQQFRFGNRSAETTLNMRDGETIVLGGLIQEEDRRTRVTMPWIGDLPLIGNLLSSFKTERVTTEVILTITPRITQTTPPPASNQAFWSGTEFTYATSPLFSSAAKPMSPYAANVPAGKALVSTKGALPAGTNGSAGSRPLSDAAVPGPVLAIQPDETAVQAGREIKLAIIDARLKATPGQTLKLEYDPKVLRFTGLTDAEILGDDTAPDGSVTFRLAKPSDRAPRSVSATFWGKAPGVSPVRVELAGSTSDAAEFGKAIVRVR